MSQTRSALAAEELRTWRQERRLTQHEAGEMLGCTHQAISNIEREQALPELRLAVAIEDLTGIPARAWIRTTPKKVAA